MATIEVNLSIQVTEDSGIKMPPTNLKQAFSVEAYDKIEFNLDPGTTKKVELISGDVNKVSFLLIHFQSSKDEKKLALKYGISSSNADLKNLDQPQIYLGKAAISALSNEPPKTLTFKSEKESEKKAVITILVGRNATEEVKSDNQPTPAESGATTPTAAGSGATSAASP